MSFLKNLFGGEPKTALARELQKRGAGSELIDFAERKSDPAMAWQRCARIDWALEIAVRLGIERALVSAGLREAAPTDEEIENLASKYAQGELEDEALLERCVPALAGSIESRSAIVKARNEIRQRRYPRDDPRRQLVEGNYDKLYAKTNANLCKAFRMHVTSSVVVAAIEGAPRHPYR